MLPPNALRFIRKLKVIGVTAAGLLISCGGEQTAGIQGSGVVTPADAPATAIGPITAFGSIFVNGVEYATSSAQVTVNGEAATEADLRVGQIVTVKGSVSTDDQQTGSASEVSFVSNARGEVAQVDTDAQTFAVLGQTVQVTDETLFDERIEPASIEGLQAGETVEISGFTDASGQLIASRIDLKPENVDLQVKGTVEALNTSTHTFRINLLTVDYGGIAPDGTLANGAEAQVRGSASSAAGPLRATSVKVLPSTTGSANERGDVQGLITSFTSNTDFAVNDQRIITDSNTQWVLHDQTLGINVFVKVKGTFNASGVLLASKVETKPRSAPTDDENNNNGNGAGNGGSGNGNGNSNGNGNAAGGDSATPAASSSDIVRGLIDSVSGNSLTLLGVKVTVSADTTFNDKSSQRLRTMRVDDLRAGDYIEVRGAANSSGLRANVIERANAESRSYLQGIGRNVQSQQFEVLGVTVMTGAQTQFTGVGSNASLDAVSGRSVKVQGSFAGGVLHADRVQIHK
jgi:hypothetical protein